MNKQIRELFETRCFPNFPGIAHGLRRKPNGEYVSDTLEDHWQTFQEGFELGIKECKNAIIEEWYEENNKEKEKEPRDIALQVGKKAGLTKAINLIDKRFRDE